MTKEQTLQKAADLFVSGYNCAQAVALAFAEDMGLEDSTVCKLASGFGGGIGGRQELCGALAGMLIAHNAINGVDDIHQADQKQRTREGVRYLMAGFEHQYETTFCCDLLRQNENLHAADPEYHPTRPCVRYVRTCTALLWDYLNA